MNQAQTKAVYALVNKLSLQAQKENIILGISNGRTSSTKELSHIESIELIKYLKTQDPDEVGAEKMRRKIIAIARSMNWQTTHLQTNGQFVTKADMKRIDKFCTERGYLHKKLNQYLYNELPKLVHQFEMVQKDYLNKV